MATYTIKAIIEAQNAFGKICYYLYGLTDDPRIEFWILNPKGQFITLCTAVMIIAFSTAFYMGFLEELKDAWVRAVGKDKRRETATIADNSNETQQPWYADGDVDNTDDNDAIDLDYQFTSSGTYKSSNHTPTATHGLRNQPLLTPPTPTFTQRSTPSSSSPPPRPIFDPTAYPFNFQYYRTGRPSTPRYQTPYVNARTKEVFLHKGGRSDGDATEGSSAGGGQSSGDIGTREWKRRLVEDGQVDERGIWGDGRVQGVSV